MCEIAEWVFESVLQFLKSPMWTAPIDNFIDEHCHEFDRELEENKLEYTELHNKFRGMVDDLLGSFLGELGVDVVKFVEACKDATTGKDHAELSHMLTEYLITMDDFTTFRAMMEHRATELELEAVEKHVCKINGLQEDNEENYHDELDDEDMDEDERFLVEMAIHASLGTEDLLMKQLAEEDAKLLKELAFNIAVEHEKALKEMLEAENDEVKKQQVEEEEQKKIHVMQLEVEKQRAAKVQETLDKLNAEKSGDRKPLGDLVTKGNSRSTCNVFSSGKSALPSLAPSSTTKGNCGQVHSQPAPLKDLVSNIQQQQQCEKENNTSALAPSVKTGEPSPQEIKEREEYFKALGNKLRAKNTNNREKEVAKFAAEKSIPDAKAASTDKKQVDTISDEEREMRIQLARRFKEDLIAESRKQSA